MRRIGFAVGALVVALVLVQLIGPQLAENRVRDMLEDRGEVSSVDVSAFPALELLFMRADAVEVQFSTLQLGTGDIGEQLEESQKADEVRVTVAEGTLGPLRLRDLEYTKDGDAVEGRATVTSEDLEQALLGINVTPIASEGGQLLLRAEAFGFAADGVLSADDDGALQIEPTGLVGGFVGGITVFEDPAVFIEEVAAEPAPDGFTMIASGRLR